MHYKWIAAVGALGLIIFAFFHDNPPSKSQDSEDVEEKQSAPDVSQVAMKSKTLPQPKRKIHQVIDQTKSLQNYGNRSQSPLEDLAQITALLESYRLLLKNDFIPMNSNRALTRALSGHNAGGVRFNLPAKLIHDGEIIDRWGIPLFFHFVSHRNVGIRSAGPDKKMWNQDDIVREAPTDIPLAPEH